MKAIAIDGPAGAGKSTIARKAAEQLGFIYVDTGALYRAVGYYMAQNGVNTKDEKEVVPHLSEIKVELTYLSGAQRVLLNQEDVSEKIRTPEVSMFASNVSAIPKVREFLFDLQQDIAKKNNVVMDGRDIGTVVLPNADVKIYLTASDEERARRRMIEYELKGEKVDFKKLLDEVRQRDYNDMHRAIAPLRQAEDAILLDTTGNELKESIQAVLDIIQKHINKTDPEGNQ